MLTAVQGVYRFGFAPHTGIVAGLFQESLDAPAAPAP